MWREIVTRRDAERAREQYSKTGKLESFGRGSGESDTYLTRLVKYTPTEVVALFVTLQSVIQASGKAQPWMHLALVVGCVLVTPLYLRYAQRVRRSSQIIASSIALPVWMLAVGGPSVAALNLPTAFSDPLLIGLLVPISTFFLAFIEPSTDGSLE